ncbi:hypothetical protein C451_00950 [Halococcus thailandensis JCM 13552]|uniref:Uncharacterized protein n=1 Tax=Halococcus thailandensis JCM 13552 TaxID=1227457 RepID=M0NFS7_9EURY|nr:hypothetical protein C451_00950 [Halococcus thailandensis JCM 13552]
MKFSGTFKLNDTATEEVWLALSDPVMIESALPGCQFLVEVEDTDVDFDELREEYADRDVEPTSDSPLHGFETSSNVSNSSH